ncbi:MAG: DUF4093 domain-containing protein [Oscillospiraceae bacterium]|jgi:ribonuclease M5|nr:DUF4093 domain-containing protein [Oscillospiraceae bacterium]
MEKLKIKQAVIVEGKYDKVKLDSIIDGVIICTNGYGVFTDTEKSELIKLYAQKTGIIVMTDSDAAGVQIRNYIKGIVPPSQITNAYIPDVFGKESRKSIPSSEGKLGVEGIGRQLIIKALENAGVTACGDIKKDVIAHLDFYESGLIGGHNSSELRKRLQKHLGLPERMSSSALLDTVNVILTKEQFLQLTHDLFEN